jgi:polygalacturonase
MHRVHRPAILAALGLWGCALLPQPVQSASPFVTTTIDHYFNPPVKFSRCDVEARAHGATGDGATDDTAAIQKAIDLTPAGGTLCIADGTYMIDAARSLALKSAFRLKLAPGATLRARPNALGGYAILKIWDRNDVVVEGGTVQGERGQHQGTTGEWGMGIDIRGSRGVTIRGVRIVDCWGDAIYLGRGKNTISNENIDIFDVRAHNNRRQGISIITGRGVAVVRNVLANTAGTGPSAGLDIEPNLPDDTIDNIHIIDLTTQDNAGTGLTINLGPRPQSSSTITVHQHTDIGSAQPFALYATKSTGAITINRARWSSRGTTVIIKRSCSFRLSASDLQPQPSSTTLDSCVR